MGRPARSWMAVAIALALIVSACQQQPRSGTATAAPTTAGEQPRSGGTLVFIVSSEPPSFDAHRETTYALLHPTSPHYSLLYKFDPAGITKSPKVVPDVAADMPQVSADKLTWTVKLRTNVKFHDGSPMTSADVVATYNKIIFPDTAKGVLSPRQGVYAAVESVTGPDPSTVVFKLKYPSGSFQAGLASPWNWIYSKAKLDADPRWYEKNVMGTGPFTYIEYVKGSHWSGRKNADYFVQGRPYLDSYRAVFIADANAQKNAVQSGQAHIEFRGFTPQQRDDLSRAMGTNLAVQENSWVCVNYITFNTTKKPFDDVRVRRALTMAIDRWSGGDALSKITIVKDVGGLSRPGSTYAMPPAELQKLAGFGRDAKAAQDQAKALLAQAGVPNLAFAFHNRSVTTPYEPVAVFAINEWKKIGVNATHQVKETSAYIADLRNKNFDVGLDFNCDYLDEPDLQLAKFYSASGLGRGLNLAHYDDKKLDDMITAQSRETDVEKRKRIVWDIEKYAMDEMAYQVPVLWWYRIIPHSTKVRGWEIGSNHYTNQDLTNVWLAN